MCKIEIHSYQCRDSRRLYVNKFEPCTRTYQYEVFVNCNRGPSCLVRMGAAAPAKVTVSCMADSSCQRCPFCWHQQKCRGYECYKVKAPTWRKMRCSKFAETLRLMGVAKCIVKDPEGHGICWFDDNRRFNAKWDWGNGAPEQSVVRDGVPQ